MPLKDYSPSDSYTYKNSPVLINLRDIRDGKPLEQVESSAVYLRGAQLMVRPLHGVSVSNIYRQSADTFSRMCMLGPGAADGEYS